MRKCHYKYYVPPVFSRENKFTGKEYQVEGTGCMVEKEGYFHQWGITSYVEDNHVMTENIAIVETMEGNIRQIHPSLIRFDKPDPFLVEKVSCRYHE
jgi:hypothetical protein